MTGTLFSDATKYNAATTEGFTGEVIDDSIRISWREDANATGYNVYRHGEYHATVFINEFRDNDIAVGDYSYHITAFEKKGEDTRFYTIANDLIVSVVPQSANSRNFRSAETPGFVGEVRDYGILVKWTEDAAATGYNVYRQGEYHATVFKNEFRDNDIAVGDYSYHITAFEKNGEDTRFYTIANGLIVSVAPQSANSHYFSSAVTPGFVGEVRDTGVLISWTRDAGATGYNVYRQGQYHTTVFDTEFHDTEISVGNYSYEIIAFDDSRGPTRFYTIAEDLNIVVSARSAGTQYFRSAVTQGFVGEVRDGTIIIVWNKDPVATGYNVYRQGQYHATVFDTEFHDTDIVAGDYSYEITAFDKSGKDTRFYTIAEGLTVSVVLSSDARLVAGSGGEANQGVNVGSGSGSEPGGSGTVQGETSTTGSSGSGSAYTESEVAQKKSSGSAQSGVQTSSGNDAATVDDAGSSTPNIETGKYFESLTTEGFVGEVLDDAIRISWNKDSGARGYNVYRQAEYYATVFSTEFLDTDVYDQDYYYEIQAFDHGTNGADVRYYYIATGLTVSARTLGRIDPNSPKPNDDLLRDYELVFADEFNGSSLDVSKWNTSFLWGTDLIINQEEQYYVDIVNDPAFGFNPFTFDGNNLTINTIRTPSELAGKSLNQPYLSGIITSYDAFKFTYGYAEMRAKMTYGRGYWPAFWLLNAYYGGADPEIDIMEFIGDNQDVVYHTFHYHDEDGRLRSTQSQPTPGIDYTADFHTFSVEWKPGTIIYFVDGIEAHRITDPNVPMEQMYLLANTAVGGWWAGPPDETTTFPGKYVIDYIRVYQKATLFNDALFNDGMTDSAAGEVSRIPYADEIPDQVSPNHRPTREQWPQGYPYD